MTRALAEITARAAARWQALADRRARRRTAREYADSDPAALAALRDRAAAAGLDAVAGRYAWILDCLARRDAPPRAVLRRLAAVRYCTPAGYALRLLAEAAEAAAALAGLQWLVPLYRPHGHALPGFTSWPAPWQAAVAVFFAALAAADVAVLRVRRKGAGP